LINFHRKSSLSRRLVLRFVHLNSSILKTRY
jgi:hypothetical protein